MYHYYAAHSCLKHINPPPGLSEHRLSCQQISGSVCRRLVSIMPQLSGELSGFGTADFFLCILIPPKHPPMIINLV